MESQERRVQERRRVPERNRELQPGNEALRRSEQILAMELDAALRLQHVATYLINAHGTEDLYEQILDAALAILHADFGSIQMFYPERGMEGGLKLLAHRGFSAEAAKRWEWVGPWTRTTCGEALRTGRRVLVPNVRNCDFMAGSEDLDGYLDGGIHAAHTLPMVSRSGALMGMLSTYWREPHELSATELRGLDILARLAADLIERSRVDEKLRKTEERLSNAERIANLGHWEWDLLTDRVSGSEEIFRIFGRPPDYILTYEGFIQELIPQDRERVERAIKDSLTRKVGNSMEYQIARPDGDVRTVSCVWQPSLDEAGRPARMFGTCQDVTDSRRAQEESFARQKLESMGTLASGIAHDFNNLLGGVVAQSELAAAEVAEGFDAHEELNAIRDVAIRGSEIVRQLMIYAGKESAVVGLVNISRVTEEMIELLKVSVSKRCALVTDLRQQLPAVRATTSQILQIIMNLVTNASNAIGDQEGMIRVTTKYVGRSPSEESSNAVGSGNYVQIEVSDTGRGMTPEMQAKAFDPFFTTKSAGHGLGLAVVQEVVRRLGGTIHLTSEPGKGTTFRILVPCAEGTTRATDEAI